MRTASKKLTALVEDPDNARTHPERNLKAIMESLRKHGQVEPLVVQKSSGRIIGGNGRFAAMKLLGWDSADIVQLDISDLQAKELGVTLNRTAELAGWDWSKLSETLTELASAADDDLSELSAMGFSEKEMQKLLGQLSTDAPSDAGASEDVPGVVYSVVVDYEIETDQKQFFEELQDRGLACRLMYA